MSTFLYGLGHLVSRRRFAFLAAWFFAAVVTFSLASVVGGQLVNDYKIPGTESQRGIDTLSQRFPQASGTTGQIVFTSTSGAITGSKADIEKLIKDIEKVEHVTSVDDPFASDAVGTISTNKTYAQSQIQFDVSLTDLPETTVPQVERAAKPAAGAKYTVTLGGDMYTSTGAGIGVTDIIGVIVAFVVLTVTFSSLLAAGMPLLTAILGVATTLAGILIVASATTISSTTPSLALMIGLAVGIDYGLFVVTRHRRQLSHGMDLEESIAQALATAGSAVVFAGTTVIIALCGLAVAQIPFLSVMGWAAASGVAIAVLAALTLLPALLRIFGEKLRPKPTSKAARLAARSAAGGKTMGARWVALVTKVPALTIVVVLVGLGTMIVPVKDLELALPDNGSAEVGSPERVSYDLVAKEFGPGFNAPLLVTADVINSTDPKTTVKDLADDLAKLPGVLAITKQTPNQTGDLGLVRVVPKWGQSDPRTTGLVQEIRAKASGLESELKIADMTVTGQTAVAIDVSTRLSEALLPFSVVVVGLALILLAIVFRSIAVPFKATLGYLLSIGSALGAVTACFIWGWFSGPLGVSYVGPVVSFMPIILMGVLFGLAMDYEVFLVSAMREDYVHGHTARHAVTTGFTSSARVVTAAAIIMISVFAAFIPHGSSTIKPIALGLAVGVFVDAFLVRMTLVPAVLALLGDKAWWIPKRLDRALPTIDIEGAALVRHVEQVAWDDDNGRPAVRAEGMVLESGDGPVTTDLLVPRGTLFCFEHPDARVRSALTWTLAGWYPAHGRHVAVLGCVLPEEAGLLRRKARVVAAPTVEDPHLTVSRHVSTVLLAQSRRLRPTRGRTRRALEQAATWLESVGVPPTDTPLGRRRLGTLSAIERRLVDFSAAVGQGPALIVVEEADAELDPPEVNALMALWTRLVETTGSSLILVGTRLPRTDPAEQAAPPATADVTTDAGPPPPAAASETDRSVPPKDAPDAGDADDRPNDDTTEDTTDEPDDAAPSDNAGDAENERRAAPVAEGAQS